MQTNKKMFLGLLVFTILSCGDSVLESYECPAEDALAPGVEIACGESTITGTASNIAKPDCKLDGDINCSLTEEYLAAKREGLAAKIVAGERIGSIFGEASLAEVEECTQNAQVGCLTTNSYRALETQALDQCLFGSGLALIEQQRDIRMENPSMTWRDAVNYCGKKGLPSRRALLDLYFGSGGGPDKAIWTREAFENAAWTVNQGNGRVVEMKLDARLGVICAN